MQPNKNYRILVIDEDLGFQRNLREQLIKHLEFEGVINLEKLDRILDDKLGFDLVMLALSWDEKKGFKECGKLIQKIAAHLPEVPIVGLVQDALLPERFEEAMEYGVKSLMTKTSDPKALQEWDTKIRKTIEGKRGTQKEKTPLVVKKEEVVKEVPRQRILLIDDDPTVLAQFKFKFRKKYEVKGVHSEKELKALLKTDTDFDLILLDVVLDEKTKNKDGLNLIPDLKAQIPDVPIFILTGNEDRATILEAGRQKVDGFFSKNSDSNEDVPWEANLINTIESELSKIQAQLSQMESELRRARKKNEYLNPPERPFIGRSPQIEQIRKLLKAVANETDITVLITGETGVGKGVAANFLHYNSSNRRAKPFEEIYISNIPSNLVPSELFGTKKAAFTGADNKKGRLESANGGIVFLDEIGDLDLDSQIKLLQFLQSKTIRPLSGLEDIKLDVQIVAATNKNLQEEIGKGRFREDLYHRLNAFPIELPPLRARREDIPLLIAHFIDTEEKNLTQLFEQEVLHFITEDCPWHGNIRQLEHTIRQMQVRAKISGLRKMDMGCIPEDLFKPMPHAQNQHISDSTLMPQNNQTPPPDLPFDQQQDWLTLNNIEGALITKNGVKNDVAEMLNFNSADLILYRIKTISKKYPEMVLQFPNICKHYPKAIFKNNKQ